jgi:DNA-binding NtrC family response regulator
MSETVATLTFGGVRRAYTLEQLEALRGIRVTPSPAPPHMRAPRANTRMERAMRGALRQATEDALREARGHVRTAAKALGVCARTLYYNCERYGIDPAAFRETPCAD